MARRALLRVLVVAATAASAVTVAGGPASAATGVSKSGTNVVVNAAAGRANNITVSLSGSNVVVQDTSDTLTAGLGTTAPASVGAALALIGLAVAAAAYAVDTRRTPTPAPHRGRVVASHVPGESETVRVGA